MNSQLKERVVGATVLVALGVLIIPWVLDGPDEAPVEAAEESLLDLPAGGGAEPLRTEIVELPPPRAEPALPPASPAPEPELEAAGGEAGRQAPAIAPGQSAPEPARAAVAPRDDAAASASAASPEPAADAAPWVVQLGAFSEIASANQLASRVASFGYTAELSPVRAGDRTLHRVRVGGFATRAQADVVRSALSAHGFTAQVLPSE